MINPNKVEGNKDIGHSIMLFALSTCVWCRKTRNLLDSLDVPYQFIYVDELSSSDKAEVLEEMDKFNPGRTFPTVVIDGNRIIVGFKKDEIERALS